MYYGVWINDSEGSGFSFKSRNRAQAIAAFHRETGSAAARGYKRVRLLEVGGARETVLAVLDDWKPKDAGKEA